MTAANEVREPIMVNMLNTCDDDFKTRRGRVVLEAVKTVQSLGDKIEWMRARLEHANRLLCSATTVKDAFLAVSRLSLSRLIDIQREISRLEAIDDLNDLEDGCGESHGN